MSALERLRRHAGKRVGSPQPRLLDSALRELPALRWDAPLVPEPFTLGYYTPLYAELSEGERLALNHWIYSLMYTRISDGEIYVTQCNPVMAEFVRQRAPDAADLLARETAEEHDHIAAFQAVKDAINVHYGVDRITHPKKPGRRLLIHRATIRALLQAFGVDFVITYFVGRGIANHMGMGFERPVSRDDGPNAGIRRLSSLHTQDEGQHMAVSRLMAAAARDFLPSAREGALYSRALRSLQRNTATYTFSEEYSKTLERAMCHRVVPHLRPLSHRSPGFVRALVDAHFDSLSGIERSRNKTLGRDNTRLLTEAALSAEGYRLWTETLASNQGNLRFLAPADSAA